MSQGNYVTFFRFNDRLEDVFVEDDHYLYAEAEPFGWAYLLVCRPYTVADDGTLIRGDAAGADCAYLESLAPADEELAKAIIANEGSYFEDKETEDES